MNSSRAPIHQVLPRRWDGLRVATCGPDGAATDALQRACAGRLPLERLGEDESAAQRARVYARCDVFALTPEVAKGEVLLEAMAAGCFPLLFEPRPDWIVPGSNGLVVEPTPDALRETLRWCATHLERVRRAGRTNARLVAESGALDGGVRRRSGPVSDALERGELPARFAFLTPEFADDESLGGGLGSYVRRIAEALAERGHEVEVFTRGAREQSACCAAVRVHRVPQAISARWVRALLRVAEALGLRRVAPPLIAAVEAQRMARALASRERALGFDAVQSSDHRATGLFVAGRARLGRPHLVRASNDEAELARRNGADVRARSWLDALQRHCLRHADVAYAPSRFLAEHYAAHYGIPLRVARPAARSGPAPAAPPEDLPKRYFVHFGQIAPAKGSPDLAAALARVWERAPDFEMVWVGADRRSRLAEWRASWGSRRRQVHWLGELRRDDVLAVVAGAEAAVLPSRFDNLPNTVIECLELGVPVIGSDGASLDELIEPGEGGVLVPIGDREALADAIVAQWQRGPGARSGVGIPADLAPEAAVDRLLGLAGLRDGPVERSLR